MISEFCKRNPIRPRAGVIFPKNFAFLQEEEALRVGSHVPKIFVCSATGTRRVGATCFKELPIAAGRTPMGGVKCSKDFRNTAGGIPRDGSHFPKMFVLQQNDSLRLG